MANRTKKTAWERNLRAGSWVIVRSKDEILATLDKDGRLESLPFQPEMFAFCGQRMRVAKVAHKTCDNIKKTGGRWMSRAYHLEGSRCDGSAHGGCQADCVFFWKLDWLKADNEGEGVLPALSGNCCTEELVHERTTLAGGDDPSNPTWVCQVTTLYDATDYLPWWDIRQYIRDVTSGNHGAWYMTKLLTAGSYRRIVSFGFGYRYLIGIYNAWQRLVGGRPYPAIQGRIPEGERTPTEITNLEVGDWVEVKSGDEIASTISKNGFNRGMRYDMEMLKYSGGRYRVQKLVERLIDEVSGKMVTMKNPCIQLENVYCRGECTPMRLGCPRASNTYWREIWLRRIDSEDAGQASAIEK